MSEQKPPLVSTALQPCIPQSNCHQFISLYYCMWRNLLSSPSLSHSSPWWDDELDQGRIAACLQAKFSVKYINKFFKKKKNIHRSHLIQIVEATWLMPDLNFLLQVGIFFFSFTSYGKYQESTCTITSMQTQFIFSRL